MLQHMLDGPPVALDLEEASALVADDLAPDEALKDLLGDDGRDEQLDFFELRRQVPRFRPILVALAARAAGARGVDHDVQYTAELLHLGLFLHDVGIGREGGRRRWVARQLIKNSVRRISSASLSIRAMEISRHAHPHMLGEVLDTLREFSDGQAICRDIQRGLIPSREDWREHSDAHVGALFRVLLSLWRSLSERGYNSKGFTRQVWTPFRSAVARLGGCLDVAAWRGGHPSRDSRPSRSSRLPLVVAMESSPVVVERWREFNAEPSHELGERLVALILGTGAIGVSREVMAQESWAARQALRDLPDSSYRRVLDKLARKLARVGKSMPEGNEP